MIFQPTERAAEPVQRAAVARFTGFHDFSYAIPGFRFAPPGLYAVACSAGLVRNGANGWARAHPPVSSLVVTRN